MSQSDYIKFKKVAQVLKGEAVTNRELPSILDQDDYTAFESYNLETTVANTKNTYSRLLQNGYQRMFDMDKKVSSCPTFILCKNTNTRTNRVLHTAQIPTPIYRMNKVYTPIKCRYTKGYVVRSATCNKTVCKCRTTVMDTHK
jgi:hypothetical protein